MCAEVRDMVNRGSVLVTDAGEVIEDLLLQTVLLKRALPGFQWVVGLDRSEYRVGAPAGALFLSARAKLPTPGPLALKGTR
jgi:hypothetical protein